KFRAYIGSFVATEAGRSYGVFLQGIQSLPGHLLFAAVGEKALSLFERQPARLLHLVTEAGRDVVDAPTPVAHKEEADDLEDAFSAKRVDVPHGAQPLLHDTCDH